MCPHCAVPLIILDQFHHINLKQSKKNKKKIDKLSGLQSCLWDNLNIPLFGLVQIANSLTVTPHLNEMH